SFIALIPFIIERKGNFFALFKVIQYGVLSNTFITHLPPFLPIHSVRLALPVAEPLKEYRFLGPHPLPSPARHQHPAGIYARRNNPCPPSYAASLLERNNHRYQKFFCFPPLLLPHNYR